MPPQYYSVRQFSPYRGVLQVVDLGPVCAHSPDGIHWDIRYRHASGKFWPAGRWSKESSQALNDFPHRGALLEAIAAHPAYPFPFADIFEFWLLNKETTMPLALLASRREAPHDIVTTHWYPFQFEDTGFTAACLAERDRQRSPKAWAVPHRDILETQVNRASRPAPAAQWFERRLDGGGLGLRGVRLDANLESRLLAKSAFPELLVSSHWTDDLEMQLVREYHAWNAPLLLVHRNLAKPTRRWLERAAVSQAEQLMKVFRLIPEFIDRPQLEVALVAARLACAR